MISALMRLIRHWLVVCLIAVATAGCGPDLPDDLDALTALMNSNNQTVRVNASNKVADVYGKDGLLVVLGQGEAGARGRAAQLLRHFPDREVEQRLVNIVRTDSDPYVRSQALCSLAKVGSVTALPVAQAAAGDAEPQVSYCAEEAVAGIRTRLECVDGCNSEPSVATDVPTIELQDVSVTEAHIIVQYRTQASIRDCTAQAEDMHRVWEKEVKGRLENSQTLRVILFPEEPSGRSVAMAFTRDSSGRWSTSAPCAISITD